MSRTCSLPWREANGLNASRNTSRAAFDFLGGDLRKDPTRSDFVRSTESERERGEKALFLCSLVVDFPGPD